VTAELACCLRGFRGRLCRSSGRRSDALVTVKSIYRIRVIPASLNRVKATGFSRRWRLRTRGEEREARRKDNKVKETLGRRGCGKGNLYSRAKQRAAPNNAKANSLVKIKSVHGILSLENLSEHRAVEAWRLLRRKSMLDMPQFRHQLVDLLRG
jgi:hypothetical protein